jgi:hypothetical protein
VYVSDQLRLVYLAQPRTASRAVARLLQERFGADLIDCQGSPYGAKHHGADAELCAQYQERGYRVVTAVRNHWDAIVSWWFCNARSPVWPSFIDYWLAGQSQRWAEPHQLYYYLQPMADTIWRYETLRQDMERTIGKRLNLPVAGASPRGHYSHYYTPETAELILEHYEEEISLYGYSHETDHDCGPACSSPRNDYGRLHHPKVVPA